MSAPSQQPLLKYPHSNNSLLSSGNVKKTVAYEPRTEAISPAINDDIINAEDSTSRSTKDEQTLIVEKLKKVEAEIVQTDLQIVRLRRQKEQLEQAQAAPKHDEDQENVCDTKQLSIAKLVYHENRAKAQKAHAKLECLGVSTDLPIYNQPSDNVIYHQNAGKFSNLFKKLLIECFRTRFLERLKLEDSVSTEYDRRMEKWLKGIELEDSQPTKRKEDAKTRDFFEKQFPELKKARESGERFSRVGQRVARSDAEVAELLDVIVEREDQDKKIKSYAVIPPMLEEMRSKKPKFINTNGYIEDIVADYKEYQILNTWTDEEKEIFKENYLQHPKNFGLIARMTGRKNVADCVQYYYLSKKSENYKGLLKRQQRRRTRSLVRPAAATPANTDLMQADAEKTNGVNENQGGDAIANYLGGQINDSRSSALIEQIEMKKEACDENLMNSTSNQFKATCCICNCDFSETNHRNVTRSNHQLYGISLEAFRPGMKICYPCRFRHVKHPSFDEPTVGSEPMDCNNLSPRHHSDEMLANDMTMMEVDPNVMKESLEDSRATQAITGDISSINSILEIPTNTCQPVDNQPSEPMIKDNSLKHIKNVSLSDVGPNKPSQKTTCVRDIIYQAIEMSFQKSTDTLDGSQITPIKQEPKIDNLPVNSIMPQQLVTSTPPTKPINASYHQFTPHAIPTPLQNAHNLSLNQQQQLHIAMQQKQGQLLEFNLRQHQLQVQMQQNQLRHQTQFPPPPMPVQQIPAPHQMVPHSQPVPNSINPQQQLPLIPKHQGPVKSPPMAHGANDMRGSGGVDDGVLNLSAKSERLKSPEAVITVTPVAPASIIAVTTSSSVTDAPVSPVASVAAVTTTSVASTTPIAPATSNANPPTPTPKQESNREDSRSPSEMVIDESANAPSPESSTTVFADADRSRSHTPQMPQSSSSSSSPPPPPAPQPPPTSPRCEAKRELTG